MAITVNYYPRMDNIAQTAYGGGQTQEGIRQQNFGLNVEQLAQRERMQNQDLGFRQGAQLFDAQVGMAQQARGIAANQQSQMYAQAGRERLAMFDAAQRQQAMAFQASQSQKELQQQLAFRGDAMLQEQAFQKQMQAEQQNNRMSLLEAEQQGRINFLKEQLDFDGKQKVAEFQRKKAKLDEWLSTPGVPESARQEAYQQLYSWASGVDIGSSIQRSQSMEEYLAANRYSDDSGMYFKRPDGGVDYRPPIAKSQDMTFSIPNPETGEYMTVKAGVPFQYNGQHFVGLPDGKWQALEQESNMPSVEKIFSELMSLETKDPKTLVVSKIYTPQEAMKEAMQIIGAFGGGMPGGAGGMQQEEPQAPPSYGTMSPPVAIPPKTMPGPDGNPVTFSRDGKYIYAEDIPIPGDAPNAVVDQIAQFSPTATSFQDVVDLPSGVYFNIVMSSDGGTQVKKAVKMTDALRAQIKAMYNGK